jgi:glycosyltransferase involved in cell wall biosynthesis
MMARLTDHIVVSNNERAYAIRNGIAPAGKLVGINNAIDFKEYSTSFVANSLRAELNIPADTVVVGSVGRLTRQKDWATFLYAARETRKQVNNVAFLIVGEGEQKPYIKNMVETLGLGSAVHVAGYCHDMRNVYPAIDIFVNTSRWEGLPYVLAEAMWYKKPVIATDLNYGQIIRDNESGCLVAAGDPSAVSGKMLDLIRNEPLRKSMGQMGYRIARKHLSFRTFIQRHQQLYLDSPDKQDPL